MASPRTPKNSSTNISPLLTELKAHQRRITALAWSRDGRMLASGGYRGRVRLWEVIRGAAPRLYASETLNDENAQWDVNSLAFTADPAHLAVLRRQERERARGRRLPGLSTAMPFTPASSTTIVSLLTRRAEQVPHDGHRGPMDDRLMQELATAPHGGLLACRADHGPVYLYDLAAGLDQGQQMLQQQPGWGLAFAPEAQFLAAGEGAAVAVWDLEKLKRLRTLAGGAALVTAVAAAPDGKHLVATDDDGGLHCWRWTAAKPVGAAQQDLGQDDWWTVLAAATGVWTAQMGQRTVLRRWHLPGLAVAAEVSLQGGWPAALALDPTGTLLATGDQDGTLQLWKLPG